MTSLDTVGVAPNDGGIVGETVGDGVGLQMSSRMQVLVPKNAEQHSSIEL